MTLRSALVLNVCAIVGITILSHCVPFRDSPFSDNLLRSERNLNSHYMDQVTGVEDDGVLRIALIADSHGNYEDFAQAVTAVNRVAGLDFTVHLGDMTNSSYNYEYDQFLSIYAKLVAPKFSVIGNHDALGAGVSLFRKAFGPSNYWFESESIRFVFWNGLSLEDPEHFDPDWLIRAVSDTSKAVLVFSHLPLDDQERFHGEVRAKLKGVIDHSNVHAVINGHNHGYALEAGSGTRKIQIPRTEGGKWLLLEIRSDGFHIKPSNHSEATWVGFKSSFQ